MDGLSPESDGNASGVPADLLLPLVYEELQRLAAQKMAHELPGQTLQATALVHEAWLRVGGEKQCWQNRAHFFAAAAEAMRRILIDAARRKKTEKHGGDLKRVAASAIEIAAPIPEEKLLDLNDALEQLTLHAPRKAELVKLRYFAGLTIEEAAELLEVSTPTAKRDWSYARAWMLRHIRDAGTDPDGNPTPDTRSQH